MVSSGKSPHDDEDAGFLVVDSCPMHPMPWTIPKDTLFPTHGWYQSSLHCSFTMWIATSSSWLFYHKWLGRLLASTSKIQSVYNFDSFPFRTHGNSCLFIHMTTFTPKESKSHPHAAGPGWPDSDGERERDPHAENVLSSSMHGHGMISFFFEAVFFSMDWFQGPPETQSIAQDFDPLIKALKDILVGQARTADCHNCYT